MQYKINLAGANWKQDKMNEIMPRLQEEFDAAVAAGDLLGVLATNTSWVDDILGSVA